MEYLTPSELVDKLEDIIRTMEQSEDVFYIAIDIAHQLKDEIQQALPE